MKAIIVFSGRYTLFEFEFDFGDDSVGRNIIGFKVVDDKSFAGIPHLNAAEILGSN